MNKKVTALLARRKKKLKNRSDSNEPPRITNETVAAHREQVLKGARKYIYPLQHSKNRIILMSTAVLIAAIIGFFGYSLVSLYRLQKYSTFMYRVTQVVPFPIARTGSHFVAYENYLFELRHYVHFNETQLKIDFTSKEGQQQLASFKQRALDKVIKDSYIKQLASQKNITVSESEVDKEIAQQRQRNLIGTDNRIFEDVLRNYYGWSVYDFRRYLYAQLLSQKVTSAYDPATTTRAQAVLARLQKGEDFAALAKATTDEEFTKDKGGEYGFLIAKNSADVPISVSDELQKLQAGQVSGIINTGTSLEILKVIEVNGEKRKAAHIVFNFKDISSSVNDLKEKQKTRLYVDLPKTPDVTMPKK